MKPVLSRSGDVGLVVFSADEAQAENVQSCVDAEKWVRIHMPETRGTRAELASWPRPEGVGRCGFMVMAMFQEDTTR